MDLAAVHFHDRLANGEAETNTVTSRSDLLEGVEDFLQELRLYSHAIITHFDCERSRCGIISSHRNASLIRRKFISIAQEVPKDLLEARRVSHDLVMRGVEMERKIELAFVELVTNDFEGVLDEIVGVGGCSIKLQLAARDAGEIKQIVDQPCLKFHIAADHSQILPKLIRQIGLIDNSTSPHQHGRERRAQFMTEVSEEAVLGGIG